jgi:surface carbohydrate biosynthesis protein
MNKTRDSVPLFIPVESQWREFDAKLLLACIAATRGYSVLIGPNREIESRIASFPKGIYFAYRMKSGNVKFFKILTKLGHLVVAWDEEALVHLPPEMYYSRRLSPDAFQLVSHLFAWGKDNVDLWRQYRYFPSDMRIYVTGHPRADLLRPELKAFYHKEAEALQDKYGQFILINTNFKHVNAFYPYQNLFLPVSNAGATPKFGRSAVGMTFEYARGFEKLKKALFQDFQQLIPALNQAFPDQTIIVRPHPVEDQKVYQRIAAQSKRVHVTNEGNVVLWLLAAKALIHNGCTTGVEAYLMGVPAISYRSTVNDYYDDGFYRLPNRLSHQSFNFEELRNTLSKILAGELGPPCGLKIQSLVDGYLAAQEGPLASERIVDVIDNIIKDGSKLSRPVARDKIQGWFMTIRRRTRKRHKRTDLRRHRYPGISALELHNRISRFQQILGVGEDLRVEQIYNQVYQISP